MSTRNKITGESYFTHRLVRTERVGNKVRQVTLLNLGRHFTVGQEDWPSLCPRIEEILTGQAGLLSLAPDREKLAQRYTAQLLLRQGQTVDAVEASTLQTMLLGLQAPAGALVVMDRGIATEQNLTWLRAQGFRYLVVSRERASQFDPLEAVEISAADGQKGTPHVHLTFLQDPDAALRTLIRKSAENPRP